MTKLNIIQASLIIGESQKTIYNKISKGTGPVPTRDGRRVTFTVDSLKDYLIKKQSRIVESRRINDAYDYNVFV